MVVGTLSLVQKGQTSGHSGCSTLWMQYTVDAVRSGIVVYGGGDIVFGAKKVKPVDTVDAVLCGCSTQLMQYAVE